MKRPRCLKWHWWTRVPWNDWRSVTYLALSLFKSSHGNCLKSEGESEGVICILCNICKSRPKAEKYGYVNFALIFRNTYILMQSNLKSSELFLNVVCLS